METIINGVIVSLITVIGERLIRNKDIKNKNKELGYWLIKWRREYGFLEMTLSLYVRFALVFVCCYLLKAVNIFLNVLGILVVWKIESVVYGGLYYLIGIIFIVVSHNKFKNKVEMWTNGKCKKKLVVSLYFIFSIPLFYETSAMIIILFGVLLCGWCCCLFEYCDWAYVLDKSYADIYVKGSEIIKSVEAGNIKKQGEWIIVNKNIDEIVREIRIKECEIVRIDYYGDPIIRIENKKVSSLFSK